MNKELKDFLPPKNSVYFKSFKTETNSEIINNSQVIEKLKTVGFRWEQRADKLELEFQMKTNMAFAIALCRIKFWRDPAPLPKVGDVMSQAEYWKRIYNSEKGRGTVEHFCSMNGYKPEEKKEK